MSCTLIRYLNILLLRGRVVFIPAINVKSSKMCTHTPNTVQPPGIHSVFSEFEHQVNKFGLAFLLLRASNCHHV